MKELDYKIVEKFSREINEINYKFEQLKNNRIYELTNNKSDGSLKNNIKEIEKRLNDLFSRIQKGQENCLEEHIKEFEKIFK